MEDVREREARGAICIYHFVAPRRCRTALEVEEPLAAAVREVFNIPIYSATYWDNWPIERRDLRLVPSDKPKKAEQQPRE